MGLTAKKPATTGKTAPAPKAGVPAPTQSAAPATGDSRPDFIPKEEYDLPTDDMMTPQIKIMQSISPELIPQDPKFVPGAAAGMLLFDATNQLFPGDVGIEFIPLAVRKYYSEWLPRNQGGGFVANYQSREEMEEKMTPGNEITAVIEYTVYVPEIEQTAAIRFNSATKYQIARALAKFIQDAQTMVGRTYRLTTIPRQNKNKQWYYNFNIVPGEWVDKETYDICKQMSDSAVAAIAYESQGTTDI